MKAYDLIILGAGPAGITAAVYAARKRLDFLVITLDIGGQTTWSGDVENYTGYQFITGPELALKFQEHMDYFGAKVNSPERVRSIEKRHPLLAVVTGKGEYLTRTLIVATGKSPRSLEVEGEKEFKNKGISYCATCDAPLFKGKKVAVIGGGNSGLDAVLQLTKLSPRVYLIEKDKVLRAEAIMVEKAKQSASVEIMTETAVKKVYGNNFVTGIEVETAGQRRSLEVEGVFVEIGLIPNSAFASLLKLNEAGEIIIDSYNRTNLEGVFAAGDVTNVLEKQIIIACGEGSKACLAAFRYLATHIF